MPDATINLPRHVGIIMDGNGRWAQKRGMPRKIGVKYGAEVLRKIARHAQARGIPHLTVYAFSTENWVRPKDEVDAIMMLLRDSLRDFDRQRDEDVRVGFLGDSSPLAPDLREIIAKIVNDTRENTGMRMNFAINYGSRDEILHAAKELLRMYSRGELGSIDSLTEADFSSCLYTSGQPDVDLIIRTSGEYRLSNFLLWQSAYAEFAFPEVLWPDFTTAHFDKALADFASRSRRKGGV